ncbi:MAG: IS3 family transposase [Candidatus Marinimicrobia bacterium]|nr:IS3 family transposase [Candidatus Neomarinimicrobiota bacterium]
MGYRINHKRVLRLMRSNDLLCKRKRGSVRTTESRHHLGIYPNLAKDMLPTSPNQLWVADLTYIRLPREFVYLAVIMDLFARRIVGWSLGRDIDTRLSISALRMALRNRSIKPGLIHHSDGGVQYAAGKYIEILKQHGIIVSMSRKGNPYDNTIIESFIKTLKHEKILLNEYESFEEANDYIAYYINEVYNKRRLYSALGYNSPVEFENAFTERRLKMVLKQEESVSV